MNTGLKTRLLFSLLGSALLISAQAGTTVPRGGSQELVTAGKLLSIGSHWTQTSAPATG